MGRGVAPVLGSVDELFELLVRGQTVYEERVDQLAHALQCGFELTMRNPDDEELCVAGLVHDIGHLLRPGDDAGHGRVGADAIRGLLGERVARLVEYHVPAKRYLVATDPAYQTLLSPVSVRTLGAQGGPMTSEEASAFESLPDAMDAVLLRLADDEAKEPGRFVPDLSQWRPIVESLAR